RREPRLVAEVVIPHAAVHPSRRVSARAGGIADVVGAAVEIVRTRGTVEGCLAGRVAADLVVTDLAGLHDAVAAARLSRRALRAGHGDGWHHGDEPGTHHERSTAEPVTVRTSGPDDRFEAVAEQGEGHVGPERARGRIDLADAGTPARHGCCQDGSGLSEV